mmetsp:Transcript_95454/g.285011  ORF Transcript_95454/g.285011 Transcript_95454/m.285011 type:complete len:221 (+) Transcript_95454:178-840(+)
MGAGETPASAGGTWHREALAGAAAVGHGRSCRRRADVWLDGRPARPLRAAGRGVVPGGRTPLPGARAGAVRRGLHAERPAHLRGGPADPPELQEGGGRERNGGSLGRLVDGARRRESARGADCGRGRTALGAELPGGRAAPLLRLARDGPGRRRELLLHGLCGAPPKLLRSLGGGKLSLGQRQQVFGPGAGWPGSRAGVPLDARASAALLGGRPGRGRLC